MDRRSTDDVDVLKLPVFGEKCRFYICCLTVAWLSGHPRFFLSFLFFFVYLFIFGYCSWSSVFLYVLFNVIKEFL